MSIEYLLNNNDYNIFCETLTCDSCIMGNVITSIIDSNIINSNVVNGNVINGNVINGNVIDSNVVNGNVVNGNVINSNILNVNTRANIPFYIETNSEYTIPSTGTFYQQQTSNNTNIQTYTRCGKIRMYGNVGGTSSHTFLLENQFINPLYSQVMVWSAQQNQSAINNISLGVDVIFQGIGAAQINVFNNDVNSVPANPYLYYMIV